MKWHAGKDCQIAYSNEMVTIIGPSGKHPTANMHALESLPWTTAEYTQLSYQFNNLASIPNYPGSYIIDRYTRFAFLDAINNKANPASELQRYIHIINAEITRKRTEFGLETLAAGQTLAQKRIGQARDELNRIKASSSYNSSYDAAYVVAMDAVSNVKIEDFALIRSAADQLENADSTLFAKAITYLRTAADSLETYEKYKMISTN